MNLPWMQVGTEEFTGGQLIPALNLLPAICITAVFISMYGKLTRTLLIMVAVILGLSLFISMSSNLEQSAVVVSELERLSGILNPESHLAGVEVFSGWAKYAAIAVNGLSLILTLWNILGRSAASQPPGAVSTPAAEINDNRSLWDEQG